MPMIWYIIAKEAFCIVIGFEQVITIIFNIQLRNIWAKILKVLRLHFFKFHIEYIFLLYLVVAFILHSCLATVWTYENLYIYLLMTTITVFLGFLNGFSFHDYVYDST